MPYGIITNCAAVFLGGILGAVLKNYFPQKLKEALPNIFGLSAITMGISLIIMLKSLSAVVLALIVGTVIGELLNLEDNLLKGLHKLEQKLPVNLDDEQMDVLISMIILFCFSGTGVFGAMNSAMTGDHSILYAKAVMDFFTAIIFGTTAGYLVALSQFRNLPWASFCLEELPTYSPWSLIPCWLILRPAAGSSPWQWD